MEPITVTADAEEFTCNAYLVSGEAPTLVDAGTMPGVDDVIADALDEAGVDGLDRVVLTHQHHDHVGQLDAVLDRFDATLYANAAHPRRGATWRSATATRSSSATSPCEVVETPGHAADHHISLVGDDRVYSGDVVVYNNDGAFDDGSFGRTDMAGQSREVLSREPSHAPRPPAGHRLGDVPGPRRRLPRERRPRHGPRGHRTRHRARGASRAEVPGRVALRGDK